MIYLDASVLVALIGAEPATMAAARFVNQAGKALVVSEFAIGEVSSAISRLFRMGRLEMDQGREKLAAFDEWAATATQIVATGEREIRLATQLVRQFGLGIRMPDAIHIATVQARGYMLATRDSHMAIVAERLRLNYAVVSDE